MSTEDIQYNICYIIDMTLAIMMAMDPKELHEIEVIADIIL